jgi:hypothetical protein
MPAARLTFVPMSVQGHKGTADHHLRKQRVELELRNVDALFNSMDPAPFHEKDLDHDAEEFIVSWMREYPLTTPVTLHVHLIEWPAEDPTATIREAVHHYFAYRGQLIDMEFRQLMKHARTSLLIGLAFLTICLVTSSYLLADREGALVRILRESLTIAGWVAMWRPMQLYLYDWWPLRGRGRLYSKLSKIPVEVVRRKT